MNRMNRLLAFLHRLFFTPRGRHLLASVLLGLFVGLGGFMATRIATSGYLLIQQGGAAGETTQSVQEEELTEEPTEEPATDIERLWAWREEVQAQDAHYRRLSLSVGLVVGAGVGIATYLLLERRAASRRPAPQPVEQEYDE